LLFTINIKSNSSETCIESFCNFKNISQKIGYIGLTGIHGTIFSINGFLLKNLVVLESRILALTNKICLQSYQNSKNE